MREEFKDWDLKPWMFAKKKDKRTGAISYDTSKDFALYAIRKMGLLPSFTLENVTPLTNGGAIVVVKCDLVDKKTTMVVATGLASISSSAENFDYAWHGQKSATHSFKYAVDMALGITSGEIQELVQELGFEKTMKETSMSRASGEREPTPPAEIPEEDDTLSNALLE